MVKLEGLKIKKKLLLLPIPDNSVSQSYLKAGGCI